MASSDVDHSTADTGTSKISKQDWSLRASGQTYYDRVNESSIVVKRLINSSSSVTGIAGRRGAGKSSLALKILETCKQKNYFTQLIHTPSSYDPREFLISVSQRTCDEVIDRLDERRGDLPSLDERAKTEERRISRFRYALWAFAVVLIVVVPFVTLKKINDDYISTLERRIDYFTAQKNEERSRLSSKVNSILQDLTSPKKPRHEPDTIHYNTFQSHLEQLAEILSDSNRQTEEFFGEIPRPEFRTPGFLVPELREAIYNVERDIDLLESISSDLYESLREKGKTSLFSMLESYYDSPLVLVSIASILILIVFYFVFRNLTRRLHLLRRVGRKETGLRVEALALAEHLSYQQTLSTSQEAGVSLFRFTSAFRRGKSLTTRSLSLPGLTEKYAAFLQKVCEVYSGGVVVCFDELDKIENPEELDQLLRGVKGILGRNNTHFLFTVSDDAIARFATRRSKEQGILESSFEDIILLQRIDFRFADRVLNPMYENVVRADPSRGIHPSTKLFWLFGGGVPREVKRNARVCLESGVMPTTSDSTLIWTLLLKRRLEDTRSWVSRIGEDDRVTADFLSSLYSCENQLENQNDFDRRWFRAVVKLWLEGFASNLNCVTGSKAQTEDTEEKNGSCKELTSLAYGRAIIDLVVGVTGGLVVREHCSDEEFEKLTPQLFRIFEHAPANFDFAWEALHEYVKRIQLL